MFEYIYFTAAAAAATEEEEPCLVCSPLCTLRFNAFVGSQLSANVLLRTRFEPVVRDALLIGLIKPLEFTSLPYTTTTTTNH